ncbi:MAG: DUF6774 domain-containing protein [Porcipelethomonas sp.]
MNKFCDELEFTTAVNTLATAIASKFETADELAAAAAVIVQIGDTMDAIAARRALCEKNNNTG